MPTVLINTPNSIQKQVKYSINQKLLATTQGSVLGLEDEMKVYPKSILEVIKKSFRSDSGYAFVGMETVSNTSSSITLAKGFAIDSSMNVYYLEPLTLNVTDESYWGFYELEFVVEDSDELTLEFINPSTVPKSVFTQSSTTKRKYSIRVYENYSTTAAFPALTPGRFKLIEYKKDSAFGSIVTTTNYLSTYLLKDIDIINDLTGGIKSVLSAEMGKYLSLHTHLIGQPIAIEGTELPDITRYIELTKDLTGVGQYNEGKLSGQAFVDVSQQRYYTAVVSDPDSPMFGQTIKLRNSVFDISSGSEIEAPCVISASSTSGSFRPYKIPRHGHNMGFSGSPGTLQAGVGKGTYHGAFQIGTNELYYISVTGQVSNYLEDTFVPNIDNVAEQNNITARFFMRIK